jgi:branched-chain amino acid transport system substrate-binding protein
MPNRRGFLAGSIGALALPTLLNTAWAAESGPIRIGWIPALTGPGSAPGIGFDRGAVFAVNEINAAGGVAGRKIELITRDTQGDPTKAVNATVELISREKVVAIWGPVNSGEALATTPIIARSRTPSLHPCVIDSLIDPAKYPNAFRIAPANMQWEAAVRRFSLDILKAKKVAIVGDTTGYGTTATKASVADFQKAGAEIVYQGLIDSTATDVTAELLRMKNAGAEVVVPWSVTTGLLARLLNARGAQKWDVPFAGHPSLGSGEVRQLLEKPEYWEKVYLVGYRSCSYTADGKLPARTQGFVERLKGKVALADTTLWWVAAGYDAIHLVASAVQATGSTENTAIIGYWNTLKASPGMFGDYTFTPQEHNGYPTEEVVMSVANSFRDGTYALAPGYT